jgi:hypothetical protein
MEITRESIRQEIGFAREVVKPWHVAMEALMKAEEA